MESNFWKSWGVQHVFLYENAWNEVKQKKLLIIGERRIDGEKDNS